MNVLMPNGYAANELALSPIPLFITNATPANIFFMIDDSGSMDLSILTQPHWHFRTYIRSDAELFFNQEGEFQAFTDDVQDICNNYNFSGGARLGADFNYIYNNIDNKADSCERASLQANRSVLKRDWRILSSKLNVLYYDPSQTYKPWPGYPDADFTQVRSHPDKRLSGYNVLRNLSEKEGFVYEVAIDDKGFSGEYPSPNRYEETANGLVDLWDTHLRYTVTQNTLQIEQIFYDGVKSQCSEVSHLEDPPYKSCLNARKVVLSPVPELLNGRSFAEIKQNIANWYQYHRRRSFIPKVALSEVVSAVPTFRYGASMINNYGNLFVEFPEKKDNISLHNAKLLDAVFAYPQQFEATPLRPALETVGLYYQGSLPNKRNPYLSECQQSFALLLSDGYWNKGEPSSKIQDNDGDGVSRTLADVAHYYYNQDLSQLPNKVPTDASCNPQEPQAVCDLNTKQHMVTYTLAFGVEGRLIDANGNGWPDPFLQESDDWGSPDADFSSTPDKIDDLWHAAYNSRGRFISAKTPKQLRQGLLDVIVNISSRRNSATSVKLNAGALTAETLLFSASFDAFDWSGELAAYSVDPLTGEKLAEVWSAQSLLELRDPDNRVILTNNSETGKGVAFRWPQNFNDLKPTEISATQINQLLKHSNDQSYGLSLINYLRGDRSKEQTVNKNVSDGNIVFRSRSKLLSDIVHSNAAYVGKPNRRYPDDWGLGSAENQQPYSEFRKNIDRIPIIYVGANGGMLHGFEATRGKNTSGKELLGYVPSSVFNKLSDFAQLSYAHQYFVDGSPVVEDVYFKGVKDANKTGWRTILVGGLGGGGQSIYALDVTDPDSFSEKKADDVVLWEFKDKDLGFTYSRPAVGRLANGQWVVVFGNGLNSTEEDADFSETGQAVLYVLNAETGELIRKFETEVGAQQDPNDTQRPNGLSTPTLVDVNQDYIVDYIYAGDLFGHLWKWDMTGQSVSDWNFAFYNADKPAPLFISRTIKGQSQAISVRPEVGLHPTGEGVMVYWGTGKYVEVLDAINDDASVQSLYGVWDRHSSQSIQRSDLLQQMIEREVTAANNIQLDLRQTSDKPMDWQQYQGWVMDLNNPMNVQQSRGERVVQNPVLRAGKVIFTTLIPDSSACSGGGSGWVMELDAVSGARLSAPVIDINNNNQVNTLDRIPQTQGGDEVIYPSGFRVSQDFIPAAPAIVLQNNNREYKYINLSNAGVMKILENPGSAGLGRQSWRQIR